MYMEVKITLKSLENNYFFPGKVWKITQFFVRTLVVELLFMFMCNLDYHWRARIAVSHLMSPLVDEERTRFQ